MRLGLYHQSGIVLESSKPIPKSVGRAVQLTVDLLASWGVPSSVTESIGGGHLMGLSRQITTSINISLQI